MDNITFKQNWIFSFKIFELTDREIRVKSRTLKESTQYTIKLEDLGQDIFHKSESTIVRNMFVSIFSILLIILVLVYFYSDNPPNGETVAVCFMIWIPLLTFLVLRRGVKDTYVFGGKSVLVLYQDRPSKIEVNAFVEEVILRSRMLVRSKYMNVDPDLPEETQFVLWNNLVRQEYISQKEYEELKVAYKRQRLLE